MSDELLETGHEPTTPAGDTILRAGTLAMTATQVHLGEAHGGRVARWDDVVAVDRGLPSAMLNAATLQRPLTEGAVDDVVARLDDFYPPSVPYAVMSSWPTPDLRARGFELIGHPPFMVRPPGGNPPAPPATLRVVEATDAAALVEVERVLVDGFPVAELQPVEPGRLLDGRVLGGPTRFWLGIEGDRAVATAAAHVAAGVVDVEMVATLPEGRGRGYGAAVTWAATLADPARPAVLIASDPGRPVYERMGYVPVLRFTLWARPGSPSRTGRAATPSVAGERGKVAGGA